MAKFFVTTTSNMPLGTGYVEIEADTREEARELAFQFMPDGRWSFDYDDLEKVHPMDRNKRGRITKLLGFRSTDAED